jgi:hypothetical protein
VCCARLFWQRLADNILDGAQDCAAHERPTQSAPAATGARQPGNAGSPCEDGEEVASRMEHTGAPAHEARAGAPGGRGPHSEAAEPAGSHGADAARSPAPEAGTGRQGAASGAACGAGWGACGDAEGFLSAGERHVGGAAPAPVCSVWAVLAGPACMRERAGCAQGLLRNPCMRRAVAGMNGAGAHAYDVYDVTV